MAGFGTAWLLGWAWQRFPGQWGALALIVIGAALGLATIYANYRGHSAAGADLMVTPRHKRTNLLFYAVNAAQWLLIIFAINLLQYLGRPEWATPCIIFIVGLHFFPLAWLFARPAHHVTGAGLVLVAVLLPLLAAGGPADPVTALAAGAILWGSALWSVRRVSPVH